MYKRRKRNKMKHDFNTNLLDEGFVKIKQYNIYTKQNTMV